MGCQIINNKQLLGEQFSHWLLSQFSSLQSLDRFGRRGDMTDDSENLS